ncbi:MAG: peptidase [Parvularcula sp.]|uniref:SapC family protein n=1 Tax=Hyphococcus sp. TaxID=2038636 RepID=UPI000C4E2B8F|nr:peptidase [Parvularcula sp.]
MSEAQALPEVTGKMYLYEQPELLMKEKHGDLGLTPTQKPFGFAAKARAVPVTLGEIPSAMKNYPLIFMSQERPSLLAVTGVYDDINLFVDDNGNWEDFAYIPAYVRRYPFGVAAEENGERMAVVIDRGYEGLTQGGQTPLFENDQMTAQTQAAVDFVKNYERDRQVTDQFAKLLMQHELIQQQSAHYTPAGASEPIAFAQYFGVDEDRLKGLSDETKLELERQGAMALAYALLMSMGNWRLILQRRAKRFGLNEQDVFKPIATN